MANKDKKKRDKKRRQRRERKGKLPSSVEALLGYLGGGGPTPAPQSEMKGRERAGYDAYDTLHSIIKAQQIQSAGYMANLEKIAFKTEMQTEIQKELKQQGDETKKEVGRAIETAVEKVGRKKRTEEEKIAERQSQIAWQMRKKGGADKDLISRYEADIKRYEGIIEYKQSIMPPASSVAPFERTIQTARAGGGVGSAKVSVAQATGTTQLPAADPFTANYGNIAGQMGILSPVKQSHSEEVNQALAGFGFRDDVSSSLDTLRQVSIKLGKQQKNVARMESEVFGGSGAAAAKLRSASNAKK
jgi:hypothetical protein